MSAQLSIVNIGRAFCWHAGRHGLHPACALAIRVADDLFDAVLAAQPRDRERAGLCLAHAARGDDLFGGKTSSFHQVLLVEILAFDMALFSGA